MRHVRNGLVNNDGYESWCSSTYTVVVSYSTKKKKSYVGIFSPFLVIWDEARLLLRLRPLATK